MEGRAPSGSLEFSIPLSFPWLTLYFGDVWEAGEQSTVKLRHIEEPSNRHDPFGSVYHHRPSTRKLRKPFIVDY